MLISSSWISPWGEGGRQGRKPQANSDPQSTHRGLVLLHPEHPKYKEGVAPTRAPVTPRFFKTERRQILPGSQQTTAANHSPQHPSHQRHICSLALGCQVTFKVPGSRGTAGWRRSRPPGGGTHHSHTQHSHHTKNTPVPWPLNVMPCQHPTS